MSTALSCPFRKRSSLLIAEWLRQVGKIWRENGALEYHEYIAVDVKVGKRTSFPRSVKLKRGEVVVFAYVVYRSRAHRDRVMRLSKKDKRHATMMDPKTIRSTESG